MVYVAKQSASQLIWIRGISETVLTRENEVFDAKPRYFATLSTTNPYELPWKPTLASVTSV